MRSTAHAYSTAFSCQMLNGVCACVQFNENNNRQINREKQIVFKAAIVWFGVPKKSLRLHRLSINDSRKWWTPFHLLHMIQFIIHSTSFFLCTIWAFWHGLNISNQMLHFHRKNSHFDHIISFYSFASTLIYISHVH